MLSDAYVIEENVLTSPYVPSPISSINSHFPLADSKPLRKNEEFSITIFRAANIWIVH